MSRISRLKHLLILIFIPFLLSLIWFRSGFIVGGAEEGLMFYNPAKTLELSKIVLWDYDGGFPTLAWLAKISSLFPTAFLYEKLNVPGYILQGGTFFILLLVGVFSVYFLTVNFLGGFQMRKKVAFFAAIFYLLNPFSISQIWSRGLYSQYFSFALLPLAILLFFYGLFKKKLIYVVYLTFASIVFSSAFGITTFVMIYWTALTVCLLYWCLLNREKFRNILFGCFFYFSSLFLWVIVNSWWFLPTIIYGNTIYSGKLEGFEENLGTLFGVSKNFTPSVIIRLLQKTYFFDSFAFSTIYSTFIFQLISFLIPTFLIIGLVAIFKIKEIRGFKFFILLFTLGLVVSLGANPPFGWLFVWIFKQFPLLQSFRNPYEKIGLVYALAYSPIFALGLVYFFEKILKVNKLKTIGLSAVLILICGIYAWPMWTGRVVVWPSREQGVDVPKYYRDLNKWLSVNNAEGYRIFMTPLWAVEGAYYQWNNTKYQGLDPTMFIIDFPAISNSPKFPYYYDFAQSVRRYMGVMDLSNSLSLLRAKYLVDRNDAIMLTDLEKQQDKYLTEFIYPPSNVASIQHTICQNRSADSKADGTAWLICQLTMQENNWNQFRYLHVTVMTDMEATIEVAITDSKGVRIRWDGRVNPEYMANNKGWKTIIIPLSNPTEYNNAIDFTSIKLVEILGHPKDLPKASVNSIFLKDIKPDAGKENSINSFHLVNNFGKLRVYEPLHFYPPPEFGVISTLTGVGEFRELFEQVSSSDQTTEKESYIILSQNQNKNVENLQDIVDGKALETEKISNTRFWLKLEKNNPAYIILSHNYQPEWKVLSGIEKDQLTGGVLNDLALLKRSYLSEKNHYVVNGYANLWKVDGQDSGYAIIFMPQAVADIGSKVSIFSIMLLASLLILWWIKKYISLR